MVVVQVVEELTLVVLVVVVETLINKMEQMAHHLTWWRRWRIAKC